MGVGFDPDAAAAPGSGVFGLPFSRAEAGVVLVPVPFDATTSYGGGAAEGPGAIRRASVQVDLYDHVFGKIYERGIFMAEEPGEVRELSRRARALALPIIERGGAGEGDREAVLEVDGAGDAVNEHVYRAVKGVLDEGKVPGVVGGDHSTPFGAMRACAERFGRLPDTGSPGGTGLGVLQIDAHMDLRERYEGFRWSHASIMFNVLAELSEVTRVVQIGIRDYGRGELAMSRALPTRVSTHFDRDWARRLDSRGGFEDLCREAIDPLPHHVYVTFDIDGLDPSLCPHTGTPVPGGLTFNQACVLLEAVARSGRRIVGFDLCEVAPGPDDAGPEWDANVGARVLYLLCGVVGAG